MAFFEKDWYMRQINLCLDMASSLLLGRGYEPYSPDASDSSPAAALHRALTERVEQEDLCGAEDLLFASLDPDDPDILAAGLDLYARMNQRTDPQLTAAEFSRPEVRDGITDLCAEFGGVGIFDQLKLSWPEDS